MAPWDRLIGYNPKGSSRRIVSFNFVYLRVRKVKQDTNNLLIRVINDSDDISQSLGITEERQEQIATFCENADLKTEKVTEMLEIVSPQLKHANELVLVGIIIGQKMTYEKIREDLAGQGIQIDYKD